MCSWYFPTFLNDELIAVPLGVALWHTFIRAVRCAAGPESGAGREPLCCSALRHSGKYYAGHDPEDTAAPQRNHPVRRLFNIEKTVELIQNALLEAAEAGETRHEHLLAHLERLQDDVSRNQSMLQEMRRRGCVRRECVFLFLVLGVALWLYVVHALTLE